MQWVQSAPRPLGVSVELRLMASALVAWAVRRRPRLGRITISYVARASRRGHRLIRAGETAAVVQEQRDRGGIMSEHDEGRRAFIVGAVGAGAVASTALVQTAYAKTQKATLFPAQGSAAQRQDPAGDVAARRQRPHHPAAA